MTLEERIKLSLGELLFGTLFLQQRIEELTVKLRKSENTLEKRREVPKVDNK